MSTTIYSGNITDDVVERVKDKETISKLKIFGVAGWIFAGIGFSTTAVFATLHEFVPVVVDRDPKTGIAEVRVGPTNYSVADPKNEMMLIADVTSYVSARENFSQAEAQRNYRKVWAMSAPTERLAWDAEYTLELNPQALVATMKDTDRVEVENLNVTFVPTDIKDVRLVQVRFDKVKRIVGQTPTTQKILSTFTVKYDPKAISSKMEYIVLNYNGFQAWNYRRNPQTEEMAILAPVAAPAPGVFPSAPPIPLGPSGTAGLPDGSAR